MPRIRIAVLLLAFVAGACSGTPVTAPTTTRVTVSTTVPPPSTTTTTEFDPLLAAIDELTETTVQIRQLEFLSPPTVVTVTPAELTDRVQGVIAAELDADEIRRDSLLLTALGLLDPGVDLAALYADLYGEQVAGFYDGETKELVVPAGDTDLTALQRLTLVHELTHALTDQHFGFSDRLADLDDDQRFEQAVALSALVEGDASLVESLYLVSLPEDVQLDVLDASLQIESEVFERTPRFLQELLLFPYTTGFEFAFTIWESDGFAGLDALYADPPTTSEHIYYPVDFTRGEPAVAVAAGNLIPDGYRVAETSEWGQAAFRAMFGQVLDDATATRAAVGWGGDTYRLLWDGASEMVFELSFVGDSSIDEAEMFETLVTFVVGQVDGDVVDSSDVHVVVEGDDYAVVAAFDGVIRMVVATDPGTGRLFGEVVTP